jgi:hypothetical protein
MGEGGRREDVGEAGGRDGRPPVLSGEACRTDGDGEGRDGEPEESAGALNGFSAGRRIGNGPGPGEDGRSYSSRVNYKFAFT